MSPTPTIATSEVALDVLFERYVSYLEQKGSVRSTIVNFVRAVVPFQAFIRAAGVEAEDVTTQVLTDYFHGKDSPAQKYAASTRRMHCQQVRACYALAVDDDVISKTPFSKRFVIPRKPAANIRTLSTVELRKERNACRSWKQEVLFALLAYGGLRKDECRRLTWEEITLTGKTPSMTFVGKATKDSPEGKVRTVPIHPELARVLKKTPCYGNLTVKTGPVFWTQPSGGFHAGEGASFGQLLEPIRLSDPGSGDAFHIHRKTLATSLSRNGVSDTMIFKILGWESQSMFGAHYFAPNVEDLYRAVLKAYADAPL